MSGGGRGWAVGGMGQPLASESVDLIGQGKRKKPVSPG